MYTYLEDIDQIQTKGQIPYNLICRIKNIELVKGTSLHYYKFLIYNNRHNRQYSCIVNERLLNTTIIKEQDTVVIEYVPVKNFEDIGECFLIRKIEKPILNLTGDKDKDAIILLDKAKKLMDKSLKNYSSYQSKINTAYLQLRKTYKESQRRKK